MTNEFRYEVWSTLAGNSSTKWYVGQYRSLPWARRKANQLTGNGVVSRVVDSWTGECVHTGH
jgi:hypothetical protein